ncbi:MAG: hypothetical protein JNN07_13335 [Verrucomicrobiales bacterium]|nr:hypothetical protein [Verrucomicrobiales bacterium]
MSQIRMSRALKPAQALAVFLIHLRGLLVGASIFLAQDVQSHLLSAAVDRSAEEAADTPLSLGLESVKDRQVRSRLAENLGSVVSPAQSSTLCSAEQFLAALTNGGVIRLECDVSINLAQTVLISRDTIIDGTGYRVVINGQNRVRLFQVQPGVTLSLTQVILTGGNHVGRPATEIADAEPAFGGAIFNDGGTVNAVRCEFVRNQVFGGLGLRTFREPVGQGSAVVSANHGGASQGGAIFSRGGALSFSECRFVSNTATGGEGSYDTDWLFVSYGSGGPARGASMCTIDTSLNLRSCYFESNRVVGGSGGPSRDGHFPFDGISGAAEGGALYLEGGQSRAEECIWHGNEASVPYSSQANPSGIATGGAVFIRRGSLMVTRCKLLFNQAERGGGFHNEGDLEMIRCELSKNRAQARLPSRHGMGGGGFNGGVAVLRQCHFKENEAQGALSHFHRITWVPPTGHGAGGGIYSVSSLVLIDSTLEGNRTFGGGFPDAAYSGGAPAFGGGLYNSGSSFATNVTFFNNSANGSGHSPTSGAGLGGGVQSPGGTAMGGAVCNLNGSLALVNATLLQNAARGGLGYFWEGNNLKWPDGENLGGALFSTNKKLMLRNTIVAGSLSGTNCFGPIADDGGNLSSDQSYPFSGGLTGVEPRLGALGDYGGGIPTLPLLPGSPARDTGLSTACPPTDQRGQGRPFGTACDIGAFEDQGEFSPSALHIYPITDSRIRLVYSGRSGGRYAIQTSDNYFQWQALTAPILVGDNGQLDLTYPVDPRVPIRAFRVVEP